MEHPTTPLSHGTNPGWQLLGELELIIGSNVADLLPSRLVDILEPLHLHADFVSRLLNSAQDAAARALHSNTESPFEHIHLSVFAPNGLASQGNTWGFFRIEKIDGAEPNQGHPDHAVEFYLYLEGQ